MFYLIPKLFKIKNLLSGYLIDTDIPEEKARQFIKKHESTFDTLSDEFIKKINYFEK